MQTENYRCPDGRKVQLGFNEDRMRVIATGPEGEQIGSYQIVLIGQSGEEFDLMDDPGGPQWFKVESSLHDGWHHQGITERVMRFVADETSLTPAIEKDEANGHTLRPTTQES